MSASQDIQSANLLTNSAFFKSFTEEQIQVLLKEASSKETFTKGAVIQQIGAPQTVAFVFEEGKVEKKRRDGSRLVLKEGETSGLLHFYQQDLASATVTALEDTKALKIESTAFKKICERDSAFNTAFVSFLTRQVRQRSNVLTNISFNLEHTECLRIAFYDAKPYMRDAFNIVNNMNKENGNDKKAFDFLWINDYLTEKTSYLAAGSRVVCVFVNDIVNAKVIEHLKDLGVQLIALRCAGFDNVDLKAAEKADISVTRVPAYSPYAVAEFAIALMMECNRKIYKSWNRVTQFNFSLNGLVGFDMHGKTVGIYGTGKIGICTINILRGFGCNVLCYDVYRNKEVEAMSGVRYVDHLDELWPQCDIISLHAPLLESTKHTINKDSISKLKKGAVIINTSRGGLVDTEALLEGLSSGQVGSAGLDVYEGEKGIFFEDKSGQFMQDTALARLVSAPNVVLTSHQAFLTAEALGAIASSVLASVNEYDTGKRGKQLTNFQGSS